MIILSIATSGQAILILQHLKRIATLQMQPFHLSGQTPLSPMCKICDKLLILLLSLVVCAIWIFWTLQQMRKRIMYRVNGIWWENSMCSPGNPRLMSLEEQNFGTGEERGTGIGSTFTRCAGKSLQLKPYYSLQHLLEPFPTVMFNRSWWFLWQPWTTHLAMIPNFMLHSIGNHFGNESNFDSCVLLMFVCMNIYYMWHSLLPPCCCYSSWPVFKHWKESNKLQICTWISNKIYISQKFAMSITVKFLATNCN